MDINDLFVMITDGIDPAEAAKVKALLEREAVKNKVSTIKAQSEYEQIVQKQNELQVALDGANGKPGSRAYEKWYNDNFAAIKAQNERIATYEAKFGPLDNPTTQPTTQPQGKFYTKEEIETMAAAGADKRIQEQYAPRWSDHLVKTGSILQKHMFAGRKNPIDFEKLGELAATKYNGNLEQAYDEYDAPERQKDADKSRKEEVDRLVKEELQRRGASTTFPAGADYSAPSTLAPRDSSKFDRNAFNQDLVKTFLTGEADAH